MKLTGLLLVIGAFATHTRAGPASKQFERNPFIYGIPERIVGGEDTKIEMYPHQLSMQISGSHLCGASVINSSCCVTAAHCCAYAKANPNYTYTLVAGSTYLNDVRSRYQIDNMTIHPSYDENTVTNDICVMCMKNGNFGDECQAVKLAPPGSEFPKNSKCTVTGWGATNEGGSSSNTLKVVSVPTVDDDTCNAAYKPYGGIIKETMCCAGDIVNGGKDSCQGDSGGPLMCTFQDSEYLFGIVSWGVGCAQAKYPGVYCEVSHYTEKGLDSNGKECNIISFGQS